MTSGFAVYTHIQPQRQLDPEIERSHQEATVTTSDARANVCTSRLAWRD